MQAPAPPARAEIYTYESPGLLYSCGWSVSRGQQQRRCVCLPSNSLPEMDSIVHDVVGFCGRACRALPRRHRHKHLPPPTTAAPATARLLLQVRPDKPFRLAVGSFIEDYANRVDIIQRE